ncbi:MAG: ABC transporter ATP-binding protein [Oscillospiraceae bacterium]|nr:ABC transporter ATP-binding protein [Oscillospiraceae bacterium]
MIKISNISKSIDKTSILENIDIEIKKGSVFGLIGVNGAGKSTLLRLMSGVYKPDKGTITYDGEPVYDNAGIKQKIFFISDNVDGYSDMTPKQLKAFVKNYYPNFSEELFDSLCEKLKLDTDKRMTFFSKGMKRQALVTAGLAARTEYLLMDEAFDGLDILMKKTVSGIIFDEVMDRGLTVVISSHNISEVSALCDAAAMISGKTIKFIRNEDSENTLFKVNTAFSDGSDPESLTGLNIVKSEKTGSVQTLIIKDSKENIEKAFASYETLFFDIFPLTLEETFLYEAENREN